MSIQLSIAVTQLISRRRATLVSLIGIALGVAFFLAVSSLMRGSERDFIKRLVDSSPHLTVYDEYRNPQPQPTRLRLQRRWRQWTQRLLQIHRKLHAPRARLDQHGRQRQPRRPK